MSEILDEFEPIRELAEVAGLIDPTPKAVDPEPIPVSEPPAASSQQDRSCRPATPQRP
ncbi:hypothetical protein LuPra_00916 [Luteitalea pratensis]|uniref:Uncharacterized protein n=1 Tax=Luteitalea pratensis TaxID=1855912 RepID=A0A143PH46_LUTPR|nr:hypothetical protein [Luteitalea pratensis]AMY07736.1 hypothetical protein LuPra_00916 [Luteitalea pratensis]